MNWLVWWGVIGLACVPFVLGIAWLDRRAAERQNRGMYEGRWPREERS